MKTNSPLITGAPIKKTSLANAVEWAVLVIVIAMGVAFFLNSNGFIDSSSIQPYPY